VQAQLILPSLLRRFGDDFAAQAAQRDPSAPRFLLPKIVDYDETTGRFQYDELQPLKQPDWTYRAPAPPAPSPKPTAKPAAQAEGHVTIRLAPEVARALSARADAAGEDLDRTANAALRAWLGLTPGVS
jgi:hypothetical protein